MRKSALFLLAIFLVVLIFALQEAEARHKHNKRPGHRGKGGKSSKGSESHGSRGRWGKGRKGKGSKGKSKGSKSKSKGSKSSDDDDSYDEDDVYCKWQLDEWQAEFDTLKYKLRYNEEIIIEFTRLLSSDQLDNQDIKDYANRIKYKDDDIVNIDNDEKGNCEQKLDELKAQKEKIKRIVKFQEEYIAILQAKILKGLWTTERPRQSLPTKNPWQPWPTRKPWQPWTTKNPWQPWTTKNPWQPWTTKNPWQSWTTRNPWQPWTTKNPWQPWTTKNPWQPWPTRRPWQPWTTKNPWQPWTTKNPWQPWTTKNPWQPWTTKNPWQPWTTKNPWQPWTTKNPWQPSTTKDVWQPSTTENPWQPWTTKNPWGPWTTEKPWPTTTKKTSPPHPGPMDCAEILAKGQTVSGVYEIVIPGIDDPVKVYCDQSTNGGGWTIIQRRMDGKTDFYRDWKSYEKGFGDVNREYWIGNDNLAALTIMKPYMLYIQMINDDGKAYHAQYTRFVIGDKDFKYKLLSLGDYSGDAGDSLSYHVGQPFSTKDQDNDAVPHASCAQASKGGWWYKYCHESNLNGVYGNKVKGKGVNWFTLTGYERSMPGVVMMIKPLNFKA